MDAVADDYESLGTIFKVIHRLTGHLDVGLTTREIIDALIGLICDGLVQAFALSPWTSAVAVDGVPPENELDQYYYYLTQKGHRFQAQRSGP